MFLRDNRKTGEYSPDELLSRLLKSYSVYYDVEPVTETGAGILAARCEFRLRQEKSPVPMSKRMLYAYDSFEYAYVFKTEVLEKDMAESCVEMALKEGLPRIHPSKEHRCSCVTAIFLCGSASQEARRFLKRKRVHKDYNFSLHGWMDLQTALVEAEGMRITTNAAGRMNAKNLRAVYSHPVPGPGR